MKTPHSFRVLLVGALSLLLSAGTTRATECDTTCPDVYDPVCGDDYNLYKNQCYLELHACLTGLVSTISVGPPGPNDMCENPDGPIGGTLGFPSWWPDPHSSSSSSGDDDSDSNDDWRFPVLPPGVVIDDSAPPAANFDPSSLSPTITPTTAPPRSEKNDTTATSGSDGEADSDDGDDIDIDVTILESAEWFGSASSTASSAYSSGDGSDDSDDDGGVRCEILCLSRFDPVCGSNGVTYSNQCELSVAHCVDASVTFAHLGECETPDQSTPFPVAKGDDPCAYLCPMWDHPVCSEDGHIYANDCVFQSMLCRDPTLQPASDDKCVAV